MKRALLLLASIVLSACATVGGPEAPAPAKAELAPTGALRIALIAVNPLFVTQNTPPGETKGIAVDIAGRLAARIGVPMKPVLYPNVGELMASAGKGEWDITCLPITPERASLMNFTAPYMFTQSTFLVPEGSTAKSLADLDQPGKTIVALKSAAHEGWLRANLRSATLVTASTKAVAMQMMKEGKVDAFGTTATVLTDSQKLLPGSRLLAGSFLDAPIALAVIKVRPNADAFAYEFMEQLTASGAIREWIEREKLVGVRSAK
jgi:polar amino acid transport system substrate-binding protein